MKSPTAQKLTPNAGCVLVKTDAAWKESLNIAGLGWTVENQSGTAQFSAPAHYVKTALAAEALALREAIWKCRELGHARIRCESDSAVLIKAIKAKTSLAGLYGVLADILSLSSCFEFIFF
ncbi:hypothetical protein Bca52824_043808 [Brassica carinata]|uniref:RNase H type-1 domain-containing protein n=3 Tax=Brassica TaxID=3705 RepID=A0A0D3B3E4_BRAOL|nr:hypothetical protein Bca52824_043808 [Brassica carinata]VDC87923.1 unnamed protein product [Brassica oleracea]